MRPRDKSPLIIYGAGGHARVVADVARACGFEIEALLDDAPAGEALDGVPVRAARSTDFTRTGIVGFIIAIGNNAVRARLFRELSEHGEPVTLVHPFTSVSPSVSLGKGVVVMPGAVVNAGTRIKDNVIINTSASVDHDCMIGAHAHLCPGVHLAGEVSIGAGTMVGTGTSIAPGIVVGRNCLIGAGSSIVRSIPDNSVAFGCPARIVRPLAADYDFAD